MAPQLNDFSRIATSRVARDWLGARAHLRSKCMVPGEALREGLRSASEARRCSERASGRREGEGQGEAPRRRAVLLPSTRLAGERSAKRTAGGGICSAGGRGGLFAAVASAADVVASAADVVASALATATSTRQSPLRDAAGGGGAEGRDCDRGRAAARFLSSQCSVPEAQATLALVSSAANSHDDRLL
eukprot:6173584-Pleurochrysis_carterae.AAC.5